VGATEGVHVPTAVAESCRSTAKVMNHDLAIRDSATVDFVCPGALVHRLDSGIVPFRKAHEYQIHVSGGEFNVAANLSDCFGLRSGMVTAMVKYSMGVTPFCKMFQHNGATGPNIAPVYSDRACGSPRNKRSNSDGAQGALLTIFPGDTTMATLDQVRAFAQGGTARVQR
jgi:2-dehydro-3-deoxygluconokinase